MITEKYISYSLLSISFFQLHQSNNVAKDEHKKYITSTIKLVVSSPPSSKLETQNLELGTRNIEHKPRNIKPNTHLSTLNPQPSSFNIQPSSFNIPN